MHTTLRVGMIKFESHFMLCVRERGLRNVQVLDSITNALEHDNVIIARLTISAAQNSITQ